MRLPDGAFFAWLHYTISEPDNLVTVPVAWSAGAVLGRVSMTSWLALYAADPAGYLVLGFLVWRGRHAPVHPYTGVALVHAVLTGSVKG